MVKSKRVSKQNLKKRKVNRKKAKSYKKVARVQSRRRTDSKIVKAKRTKRNNAKSVKSVQSKRSARSFNKRNNRTKQKGLVKKTKSLRIKSNISIDSTDDEDDEDEDDDDHSPPPPKLMEKLTSPPSSTTSIISISVSSGSEVTIDQSQKVPPHSEQVKQVVKQMSPPKAPPLKPSTTSSIVEPKKSELPESEMTSDEIQWEVSNSELEQHEDISMESVESSSSTEMLLSSEDSTISEVSSPSEESEEEVEEKEMETELPETVQKYLHSQNFTLVKYIVSSTTCSVYKVTNGAGQLRAAKVINHSALSELIRDTLLPDELAILRSVRHPNIILTDAILTELPNYSIIISEFASEGDLTGYIAKTGVDPPELNLARKWFREITNAMVYLHQKYIAHRDIKLDNILLFEELIAKLCDFGFATHCRDPKTGAQVLCETYCGTVEYQAPEILLCEAPYNGMTADCFSLGVFLYRLITGRLPFGQDTKSMESTEEHAELHRRIQAKQWANIGPIARDENLRSLLMQLLNPNTEERIQVEQVLAHRWISRVE